LDISSPTTSNRSSPACFLAHVALKIGAAPPGGRPWQAAVCKQLRLQTLPPLQCRCRETEPELDALSYAYVSDRVTVLRRKANEGMDFAAHNTTLEWLTSKGQLK
jgi:hypothetical protein